MYSHPFYPFFVGIAFYWHIHLNYWAWAVSILEWVWIYSYWFVVPDFTQSCLFDHSHKSSGEDSIVVLLDSTFSQRNQQFIKLCVPQVPTIYSDCLSCGEEVYSLRLPKKFMSLEITLIKSHDRLRKCSKVVDKLQWVNFCGTALWLFGLKSIVQIEDMSICLQKHLYPRLKWSNCLNIPWLWQFMLNQRKTPFLFFCSKYLLCLPIIFEFLSNRFQFLEIILLLIEEIIMERVGLILAKGTIKFIKSFTDCILQFFDDLFGWVKHIFSLKSLFAGIVKLCDLAIVVLL